MSFIDTHCHLDAPEFGASGAAVRAEAARRQVVMCVLPAVELANFETVRALAHAGGDSYALGIHPLYVKAAQDDDLDRLDAALQLYRDDPRLVAVGEIGLDLFVPELCIEPLRARQMHFYLAQLKLARKHGLPVLLHVRRSVDQVLKGLRTVARTDWHGIAHAFNGSAQQANNFIDLGFKLGFGGALTYERALQLRRLAATLPLESIVLETDAPDMPPHWLYKTAQQRDAGDVQGINSPAELPRIGAVLAGLRGLSDEELALATTRNALEALPKLGALVKGTD
ncbi:MAG: TatD family hydrolase [Rhodoferax sp.]|nr:TatD family hydrolase [Rhodoferax sp.]